MTGIDWRNAGPALLMLLAAGIAGPAGSGEVYQWTDADGRVHFGDRPPPTGGVRRLKLPETGPSAPAPGWGTRRDRQQRLLDAFREERLLREQSQAEARAEAEQRRRRCHESRDRLRSYTETGRIYDLDEGGDRVYLDAAGREALLERWRRAVARWCD